MQGQRGPRKDVRIQEYDNGWSLIHRLFSLDRSVPHTLKVRMVVIFFLEKAFLIFWASVSW